MPRGDHTIRKMELTDSLSENGKPLKSSNLAHIIRPSKNFKV